MVSGKVLLISEVVLNLYRCQTNNLRITKTLLNLVLLDVFVVSGGCLECVCGIPGWSLSVLEGIIMSYQVKKDKFLSCNLHTVFSPSVRFLAKSGKNGVFSDPCYGGSNIIVDQNRNIPQVLYIKLHLKMPGNINFV